MIFNRTSKAQVETTKAARYLIQLGKHFAHEAQTRPGRVRVHYDDKNGFVDFGWVGNCTMHAQPEGLQLHAAASDLLRLRLVQRIMGSHLERYGRRDRLTVRWSHARSGRLASLNR